MSPIPEMDSSKGSITTAQKTMDDDRQLTGTGNYNLDKYQLGEEDEDEEENYSDDFEEEDDYDTEVSTGGTASAGQVNRKASENKRELD